MKIGPVEVETKITLSGLLAMVLTCVAALGGWYSLKNQQAMDEMRTTALEKRQDTQEQFILRMADSLNDTNRIMGILQQRLNDANIGSPVLETPPKRH